MSREAAISASRHQQEERSYGGSFESFRTEAWERSDSHRGWERSDTTRTESRYARNTRARRGTRSSFEASTSSNGFSFASFGGSRVVSEARRYLGTNPTGRASLWCARFMNMVLERTGHRGTGSDMARSFASYGHRVSGPRVGAIAVMARRGGGHVGVVSGLDSSGNPIIISGNHGRRVAETVYPRGRVYAYVMPL